MLRSTLLTLCLGLGSGVLLQAQASHLPSVPIKDFASIQVNYFDDGAGTITKQWTEKRFDVATSFTGEVYLPATPKKETFVITDAEFTLFCKAASPSAPLFSPIIQNVAGDGWIFPTRVRPTLTTPGQESIHVSFTAGVVVPPGFTFTFPVMAAGNHEVRRAIFFGYYTK
ncbi:MAG: hypothetical protein HY823_03150 [Acidobacteria bacterium]|nr:hypothetical protein [Acidobacteriota bacterium]